MSSRFGEGSDLWLARAPKAKPGQEGGKRAENRRKRINELCEAGLLLFLERGVEGVIVEDITRKAGVAKGSFYRYLKDKRELVNLVVKPVGQPVLDAMEQCAALLEEAENNDDLVAAYTSLGMQLTQVMLPYLDVVLLYLQEYRSPSVPAREPIRELADAIASKAIELTEVARRHELLRPFPAKVSALAVVGAIERLTFAFLTGDPPEEPEVMAQSLISMVMDGLRPSS